MYLLDANVFIEAKDRYFGFDIGPGFWEWLLERHDEGTVFTIDAVRSELLNHDDELSNWTKALPRSFFLSPGDGTILHLEALSQWAYDSKQQFRPNAITEFLGKADYLLIGQARQLKFTIVTQEQLHPNARNRILIPVACQRFGVRCINSFEFMRQEGLKLVLNK